jgi:hypothetical protein
MGRDKHEKDRQQQRLPPFVPLLIDTLNQPAWRALSHGAQMLYVALKRRFNLKLHNNGKLFLSQRMASAELRSHHNQIARWYRELQHYGFIVIAQPGCVGVEGKGRAPRWRLGTALCFCVSENRSDIARATSTPGWHYPPSVPRRNTASARA